MAVARSREDLLGILGDRSDENIDGTMTCCHSVSMLRSKDCRKATANVSHLANGVCHHQRDGFREKERVPTACRREEANMACAASKTRTKLEKRTDETHVYGLEKDVFTNDV